MFLLLSKWYLGVGIVWTLLFMGWWACKEYRGRSYRVDVFEVMLLLFIFVCTWIAWPWSVAYNLRFLLYKEDRLC